VTEYSGRRIRSRTARRGTRMGPLLLAAIATLASACAGDARDEEVRDVTVRDSAGVTIVESGRAPSRPLLTLDTSAAVDIGETLDEDPDYQLFQVASALRLSDGTIVVANRGSHQLKLYDSTGRFVRNVGRQGAGPGEFEQLNWMGRLPGDTIVTYDFSGRRLSRFLPDGEFAGSVTLGGSNTSDFVFPVGMLDDGRMVVRRGAVFTAGESPSGRSRDSLMVMLAGADGIVQDTLGRFPGTESSVQQSGSGNNRMMMVTSVPFARGTYLGVHRDAIVVATNDTYEIRLFDTTGQLRRIVRRLGEPVPVTPADVEAYRQQQLESAERSNAQFRTLIERQLADAEYPQTMPAYTSVMPDAAGRLWVRESTHMGEPPRWAVYDPDGALMAELTVPDRFRPLDIGEDYVLGVLRDELELERVLLYRLAPAGDLAIAASP
jgi:hypothetical protein